MLYRAGAEYDGGNAGGSENSCVGPKRHANLLAEMAVFPNHFGESLRGLAVAICRQAGRPQERLVLNDFVRAQTLCHIVASVLPGDIA